jgi:hypothetical protein
MCLYGQYSAHTDLLSTCEIPHSEIRVNFTFTRNTSKIFVRNLQGRDHLEDLGIDGKIILE